MYYNIIKVHTLCRIVRRHFCEFMNERSHSIFQPPGRSDWYWDNGDILTLNRHWKGGRPLEERYAYVSQKDNKLLYNMLIIMLNFVSGLKLFSLKAQSEVL